MTLAPDHGLLARLEGIAPGPVRGTVVVFEECVTDAGGTRVQPAVPVLVPDRTSPTIAGLRFTLRSLRRASLDRPSSLPLILRAAARNLRGGRRLGTVVILTRRPDASWVA